MTKKKPRRKAPVVRKRKIEVVLKIRSLHPSLPAPVAAEKVAKSSSDLEKHLRGKFQEKYGAVRVSIARRKTFPVDPVTILVTVAIFIGHRVAGKAVDKMIDTTVTWAKGKLKGARVSKGPAPPTKRSEEGR